MGSLVEGDPIVALSWLHNGVKLALHVEKVGGQDSSACPPATLAPPQHQRLPILHALGSPRTCHRAVSQHLGFQWAPV